MTSRHADNPFAQNADAYAQARPRYPQALYDWLAANSPAREAAWDCATGNGQAAVGLAPHFSRVEASDISAEQVGAGLARPNVRYSVQPAEQTTFADDSFDLITVAQALHWFDCARFWPEVARVARPGALFCAWGYVWPDCDPAVDAALVRPVRALLEPHWAANNGILWRGYRSEEIAFPLERLATPAFSIHLRWRIDQVIGYLQTWSAYQRASRDARAAASLNALGDAARRRFAAHPPLKITMPLEVVAGRIHKR